MVARKVPAKKAVAKKAPAKKAVAAKKAAPTKKAAVPTPEILLDELPKQIRQIVLAKAEGDITRISIISHTEILITNPRNGK